MARKDLGKHPTPPPKLSAGETFARSRWRMLWVAVAGAVVMLVMEVFSGKDSGLVHESGVVESVKVLNPPSGPPFLTIKTQDGTLCRIQLEPWEGERYKVGDTAVMERPKDQPYMRRMQRTWGDWFQRTSLWLRWKMGGAAPQPAASQPATSQPAATGPATSQPATSQPAPSQPSTTGPAATQPAPR